MAKMIGSTRCGVIVAAAVLAIVCAAVPSQAKTVNVRNSDELQRALNAAQAGDEILLLPGVYEGLQSRPKGKGTANSPIVVRANAMGDALIRVNSTVGITLSGPYWRFENLDFEGVCANHSACEHAMHITGSSDHTVVRNSRFRNFNAAIKGNGFATANGGNFPDHVIIERSYFYNDEPRQTPNPVTAIDVVGGRGWILRDNFIADYEKAQGNKISYMGFLKGGAREGLIERNLVICEWRHSGNIRVPLSIGGGGTGDSYCEGKTCEFEADRIVMRNNITMNCPADTGLYLNKARNSRIYNNLYFNTSGIDVRFGESQAVLQNNVITASIRPRDGGQFSQSNNVIAGTWIGQYVGPVERYVKRRLEGQDAKHPSLIKPEYVDFAQDTVGQLADLIRNSWLGYGSNPIRDMYASPDDGDFALRDPDAIVGKAAIVEGLEDDFCGNPRGRPPHDIGPIEYGSQPCDPRERIRRLVELERAQELRLSSQ